MVCKNGGKGRGKGKGMQPAESPPRQGTENPDKDVSTSVLQEGSQKM